uniref:NADH-ubiquinone oxidoreductase chain 6 n=1 Tax=Staphylinidae sp. 2 EF-2015 TaxID=1759563 RepID=A0A0S2M7H1_9COLE|nr:NADH deshydrogenase subunit 6 [Staphylinidae sp. 2 EF-2015]
MIFMMNLLFSFIFMFMKHPMSMGLILLLQTLLISLMTGYLYVNFWFSYILFLIMVGGMLILFIYMTSIASNEKFKFSMKLLLYSLMFILIFIMFMMFMDNLFLFNFMNIKSFSMNFFMTLNKFFSYPNFLIFLMLIIYLLITMIMVVKIININKGPLRKMF